MKRLFSCLSVALSIVAMAVSSLPAAAVGSSGLSITPRKNYIIEPGKSVTDKLTIGNLDATQDLNVSLRMIDFTYTDQTGTPKLYLAQNAAQTPWSLKPYTTLPQSLTVPHGSSKTINYTINIPKTLGAGSYYSAILYQAGGANGGNVALNASGVTLAFVSVPGVVNEKMTVQKLGAFNSDDNGTTGSYVFIAASGAPKMIAYALKNEGNVAEAPAGNITLKDMFGHTVNTIDQTNTAGALALRGQTRLFATCIKTVQQQIKLEGGTSSNTSCVTPKLIPGRYTASLDVFYGQNGNQTHELTATAHFWYLPWWFLAILLAIILLIAGGIWWLQRKIKLILNGPKVRGIKRRK